MLLYAGLCALAERWLGNVVFPRFRDTAPLSPSLRAWFDDPAVQRSLESLEAPPPVRAAMSALGAVKAAAVAAVGGGGRPAASAAAAAAAGPAAAQQQARQAARPASPPSRRDASLDSSAASTSGQADGGGDGAGGARGRLGALGKGALSAAPKALLASALVGTVLVLARTSGVVKVPQLDFSLPKLPAVSLRLPKLPALPSLLVRRWTDHRRPYGLAHFLQLRLRSPAAGSPSVTTTHIPCAILPCPQGAQKEAAPSGNDIRVAVEVVRAFR